jgi:hypothetical protein
LLLLLKLPELIIAGAVKEQKKKEYDYQKKIIMAEKKWIKLLKKPGALREQLGVKKGKNIPKAKLAAAERW